MKKLFAKLFLAGLPILIVISIYIRNDPFKVLYHYDAYYSPVDSYYYDLDDDYISTQTLIQNSHKYKYDSFIFGSSRSENYLVSEWQKYITASNSYHFGAALESLYGVEKKVEFLKNNKYEIKNALFIIDNELLSKLENEKEPIRLKHPALSGMSWLEFQLEFLKYFFDKDFLVAYLDLHFSGHLKKYMYEKGILGLDKFTYKITSNEGLQSAIEQQIEADSDKYYNERARIFYRRDTALHYTKPVIGSEQKKLLINIKQILTEKHTNYKIVISPLYNQDKFDTSDLKILYAIFNKDNIYDFSGKNSITDNKHNYYEIGHYRIRAATEIINDIYKISVN